jgi:hypothetical protein
MAKKKDEGAVSSAAKGHGTTIAPHKCHNPYQDKRYGRGQRVWNLGIGKMRCTVCGEEKK